MSEGRHSLSEKLSQFEDFFDSDGGGTHMGSMESGSASHSATGLSSSSLSHSKEVSAVLKDSLTRRWMSDQEVLSDLDEGDEEEERTESNSRALGHPGLREEKPSEETLRRIQQTIESMDHADNTLTKTAYYMARMRELTFTHNGMQLRAVADRGGIGAIVRAMERHLNEDKSTRFDGKDDGKKRHREKARLQQLGVSCLANLAHQSSLCSVLESKGAMKTIFAAMKKYSNNANLQEKGLCAICCFARISDYRRILIERYDTVKAILVAMANARQDVHVQRRGMVGLHRLSMDGSDTSLAIGNSGGIDAVLSAMKAHPKDAKVQMLGCAVLKALCRKVESNKTLIVSGRGLATVLHAMTEHESNSDVQEEACRLFGHLSICHVERKFSIARSGALERIVQAMRSHPKTSRIQVAGCVALFNLTEKLQIAQMANGYGALAVVRVAKSHSPDHARQIMTRLRLARYAPIVWFS